MSKVTFDHDTVRFLESLSIASGELREGCVLLFLVACAKIITGGMGSSMALDERQGCRDLALL